MWHDVTRNILVPTYQLDDTPFFVEERVLNSDDERFLSFKGMDLIKTSPSEIQAKVACMELMQHG